MLNLQGKKVLIGITGAIAAYKTLELIRKFKRAGACVKVIVTENALEFVTLKTLETLSLNRVFHKQFCTKYDDEKQKEASTVHISLATWADILVIAPLSANTLSKIATGVCDNLLCSIFCAMYGASKNDTNNSKIKTPILLAPSMNDGMWANEFVQKNLKELSKKCTIIEPESGFLACNTEGKGRLANIDKIFDVAADILTKNLPLKDKKIVISAGGTREFIDPVRCITNLSSGKMGLALADSAYDLGAYVELVCTFDVERDYKITKVNSAIEMQNALESAFFGCKNSESIENGDFLVNVNEEMHGNQADCLIMAAAVADYRPCVYNDSKLKSKSDKITLEMTKNPDILAEICKKRRENKENIKKTQKIVGFCLSTEDVIQNAKEKIEKKGCDFIIANEAKTALGTDETEVWIIDKDKNVRKLEKDSKENIAKKILGVIYD